MALHVHLTRDGGVFIKHNRDEKRGRDAERQLLPGMYQPDEPQLRVAALERHIRKLKAEAATFKGKRSENNQQKLRNILGGIEKWEAQLAEERKAL